MEYEIVAGETPSAPFASTPPWHLTWEGGNRPRTSVATKAPRAAHKLRARRTPWKIPLDLHLSLDEVATATHCPLGTRREAVTLPMLRVCLLARAFRSFGSQPLSACRALSRLLCGKLVARSLPLPRALFGGRLLPGDLGAWSPCRRRQRPTGLGVWCTCRRRQRPTGATVCCQSCPSLNPL